MNVNGIGTTGYPAWQGARKAENSAKGDFGANVKSTGNVVHIDPDAVFSIHHVKTGESANVYRADDFSEDTTTSPNATIAPAISTSIIWNISPP